MKKFILFILVFTNFILKGQNASDYLPIDVGNVWVFQNTLLDSANNPLAPPTISIDSSIAYTNFLDKPALFIVRRAQNTFSGDTLMISANSQSIFIYPREIQLDTILTFNFPDWIEYYRFTLPLGSRYTIFSFDTTVTIPQIGTLPLRFIVRGTRLGLDTLTVPAGFFNATKFKIEFGVQYKVTLPPPLPPYYLDLFNVPIYDWLVLNRYIVKSYQEPFRIDTLNISIPGNLRELIEFRTPSQTQVTNEKILPDHFYVSNNFPNPFNSSTTFNFYVPYESSLSIKLYNVMGKEIKEIISNKTYEEGMYTEVLEFNDLASGTYIVRFFLSSKESFNKTSVISKKIILIK